MPDFLSRWFRHYGGFRTLRIPILAALLISLLVGVLTWQLLGARRQLESRAASEAANLSALLQTRLQGAIGEVDVAMRGLILSLPADRFAQRTPTSAEIEWLGQQFENTLSLSPFADNLGLIGADGTLIYTHHARTLLANASDLSYLDQLKTNPSGQLLGTPLMVSNAKGEPGILLARRMETRDGAFAGAVIATINRKTIRELFERVNVGLNGGIALRDDQMNTIVREPDIAASPAKLSATHPLRNAFTQPMAEGVYRHYSSVDNVMRIHSWRRLPGMNYLVVVGLAESDYLTSWYSLLWGYAAAATAMLLLLGGVAWLYHKERSESRTVASHKELLEKSEARLRTMIESLPFPLVVTRIADRRAIYANALALQLFALPEDCSLELLVPENFYQDPADRAVFFSLLQKQGRVDGFEVSMRKNNGEQFWSLLSAVPLLFDHQPAILSSFSDIHRRKMLEESLRVQAQTDGLTGIANRGHWVYSAKNSLSLARETGEPVSLLMVDIDYFKQINDTYGHATGDTALVGLAHLMQGGLRHGDVLGRLGGEEFAIILPNSTLDSAAQLAERLRQHIEQTHFPLPGSDASIKLTISLGVTAFHPETDTVDTLLIRADHALYAAKRNGRNRVEVEAPPMTP